MQVQTASSHQNILGFSVDDTDKAKTHERMKKRCDGRSETDLPPGVFKSELTRRSYLPSLPKEEVKKIAKLFIDELRSPSPK